MFNLVTKFVGSVWSKINTNVDDVDDDERHLEALLRDLELKRKNNTPPTNENSAPDSKSLDIPGRNKKLSPTRLKRFGEEEKSRISSKSALEKSEVVPSHYVVDRVIVSKVVNQNGRNVIMENLQFNLDSVVSNFIPMQGDWLELNVKVQSKDNEFFNDDDEVIQVVSVKSVRSKVVKGFVTRWQNGIGLIDNKIFFTKQAFEAGYKINVNDEVVADVIECDQGKWTWRAITVALLDGDNNTTNGQKMPQEKNNNFTLKKNPNCRAAVPRNFSKENSPNNQIAVSGDCDFGTVFFGDSKDLTLEVINTSSQPQILTRSYFQSKRYDSQLKLIGGHFGKMNIPPGEKVLFNFTCVGKFMGYAEESFVFKFEHFYIKRQFKIYVIDSSWADENFGTSGLYSNTYSTFAALDKLQSEKKYKLVRGIRNIKAPNFIQVRLPSFNIPDDLWNVLYGFYKENFYREGSTFLTYLVEALPCLLQETDMNNYIDKFHTLLYLEEMRCVIKIKQYDMTGVCLTESQSFLSMEVEGLSEKRPSLMVGDSVRVISPWAAAVVFEGFIHKTSCNVIYMKFSDDFRSHYNGEEVTISFQISRGTFMKCHQAIELAVKQLKRFILFPNHLELKEPQVDIEPSVNNIEKKHDGVISGKKKISWYNNTLNTVQKEAIENILQGVARPLPYIIFGPPGTGKTVTVVETVLQIIKTIPESRILIATPSNSSANLLCERIVSGGKYLPGFLVRLIAQHLVINDNIPENIKEYCATLDINAGLNDYNKTFKVKDDGVRLNCSAKFGEIGRHRITIGTCFCIGTLYRLGLPKGHFTHIIVDEAAQTTEPELMIALAFADESNTQIVLAGDPKQLGAVLTSLASQKFGLGYSYMERLLERFPYKKDPNSSTRNGGFDQRLVTQLVHNYRSLPKLLNLTSELFYEGCLIPMIDENTDWVCESVKSLSEMFSEEDFGVRRSDFPGVMFHGVRGINYRGEDSPSWFNPHEAVMVLITTRKLYKKGFTCDDIGIIAPYIQQIKYLRGLFEDMNMEIPKIGSVEEFQGQERKIIMLTTVRSTESFVEDDVSFCIGFVKNPKRLNVALSRAQVMTIIFGNPYLLSMDSHWCTVIKYFVKNGIYTGSDLPSRVME